MSLVALVGLVGLGGFALKNKKHTRGLSVDEQNKLEALPGVTKGDLQQLKADSLAARTKGPPPMLPGFGVNRNNRPANPGQGRNVNTNPQAPVSAPSSSPKVDFFGGLERGLENVANSDAGKAAIAIAGVATNVAGIGGLNSSVQAGIDAAKKAASGDYLGAASDAYTAVTNGKKAVGL